MYSTIVLLLALGYVGVLAQLETTTYVPIRTNFTSTFKVNFEVTSCKIVGKTGSTTLSPCDVRTTPAACVAENKVTFLLDLSVKNVDDTFTQIIFKPISGEVKKYSLTAATTSSSNIEVKGSAIDVKNLDVGIIVKEAHMIKIDKNGAVDITSVDPCEITGPNNCVGKTNPANIYFKTTDAEQKFLICKGAALENIFQEEVVLTPSENNEFVFAKAALNIGFNPTECKAYKSTVISNKINANCKEDNCFYNTVTSDVTVNTNPINEDLAILLDGSLNTHKMTFKPIECGGFITSFSVFGLIAAYWIARMEL